MTAAEVWDAQARTLNDAKRAVWADPDWAKGRRMCLGQLAALPPSGDLLDLGAGVGRLTLPVALARPDAVLWAVDVSKRMLGWLKTAAREEKVRNIRCRQTNGRHVPASVPSGLAGAWSILTFQHLPRETQRHYLLEMGWKLKPGGTAVVQFVEGAGEGPLSHPVDTVEMWEWMDQAGLKGTIEQGSRTFPTWRWMHATKTS